jgi:hypothetical protein
MPLPWNTNLEAAFLSASANNMYLSSIRGINGLFFPQIKEIFKQSFLCLMKSFLISSSLRIPCTNNDTGLNVGKVEVMACKCVFLTT